MREDNNKCMRDDFYLSFEDFIDELQGRKKQEDSSIKFNKEYVEFRNLNAIVSEESKERFDGFWYEKNRPTIEKIIQFTILYTLYCQKRLRKSNN